MNVQHDMERSRFIIRLPEGEAHLVYAHFAKDVIDLQHTEVPSSAQGQGVGDALVRAALAHAREHGLRVVATCPYVRSWLKKHPEEPRPG